MSFDLHYSFQTWIVEYPIARKILKLYTILWTSRWVLWNYVMYKDLFQPSFNVTQDFKEVRVIYLWQTKNNLSKIFSCYAKIPGAKQSSDCLNHCHQKEKKPACPRGEKYFTIILGLEFGYKYQSVYVKFVLCKKRNKLDGWKRSCKRQHCKLFRILSIKLE